MIRFKGHAMGGFGGSLRDISIGRASGSPGRKQLHEENGRIRVTDQGCIGRVVEEGRAVASRCGSRITCVNVPRSCP